MAAAAMAEATPVNIQGINLAAGALWETAVPAARLLALEDIEEEQPRWHEMNRVLADLTQDSHIRVGLATFAEAAGSLTPHTTIHPAWVKWRVSVLEAMQHPSQVQIPSAPTSQPAVVAIGDGAESANVTALRRAYMDAAWLAENRTKWVVIYRGTISGPYLTHSDAMGAAIDAHGMLGQFMCPYIADIYCHYKAVIYDQQGEFAEEVRDL
jgi:hypothetical protein